MKDPDEEEDDPWRKDEEGEELHPAVVLAIVCGILTVLGLAAWMVFFLFFR